MIAVRIMKGAVAITDSTDKQIQRPIPANLLRIGRFHIFSYA